MLSLSYALSSSVLLPLENSDKMSDIYTKDVRTLGQCICIITGASKGFGRALAHEVVQWLKPGSILLLAARSGTLLEELKDELQGSTEEKKVLIHCITADVSTEKGVNEIVRVAKLEAANDLEHVLLINNAATLGDLSPFASFTDPDEVNSYMFLNVGSALVLTAGILKVFPRRPDLRWSVVNVSSVFAVEALPSWVLYCTAKAARKMMFGVLAEEEPNVKVLSYSPGSLDTEMQQDIKRMTGVCHHLMPCHVSAAKLLKLLLDNEFPSGAHIDFFEV
ncbi:sepiapterin reductase b [Mugil cephalus]|uniref:sepiapterin reductase b n=1 Tax=Mugil cephalus TaxID=48193 RepID=UPI001FB5EDF4|nr:sepiapterin reductase b [Mugil cephalus]